MKQKQLANVGAEVAKLQRMTEQDKAMREGWSVAEGTCDQAIKAIQTAIENHVTSQEERNQVLMAVAGALDGKGNPSGFHNCGRLIQDPKMALSRMVMAFWKRKCSEQIRSKMRNKENDMSKARRDLLESAKKLHTLNIDFERSIEQIMTSSNVTSKYVVTIEYLANGQISPLKDIRALNRVMERTTPRDEIYSDLVKDAWEQLRKCPQEHDDSICINVSKSWLHETCKLINGQAQLNCSKDKASMDVKEFHFNKSMNNKVSMTYGDYTIKVELSISSNRENLMIQVRPKRS